MDFENLLDSARTAFMGMYHDPAAHAKFAVKDHSKRLEKLLCLVDELFENDIFPGGNQACKDKIAKKYRSLFTAYLGSAGRCMCVHVTGGSKYPRMAQEKAHEREQKNYWNMYNYEGETREYLHKVSNKIKQQQRDEITELKTKLENFERRHNFMLAVNKIVRSKASMPDKVKALQAWEVKEATANRYLTEFGEDAVFEGWQLQNSRQKIRATERRIHEVERWKKTADIDQASGGFTELTIPGGIIILNSLEQRLQIIFEEKPDNAMRQILRAKGFRWAPTVPAWQRKLTVKALDDAKQIFQIEIQTV